VIEWPGPHHRRASSDWLPEELEVAPTNHALGTTLWFENERARARRSAEPGEGGIPHATSYFWTVVARAWTAEEGRRNCVVRDYRVGTPSTYRTAPGPMIHDLENVGTPFSASSPSRSLTCDAAALVSGR
jgi:hypothetical protein